MTLDLQVDVTGGLDMLQTLGDEIPLGMDEALEEIAREGRDMVLSRLGQVLQHPTGYYESRITAEPQGDYWTVTDGGVIYGPWLEGVGRRNQTTRFKGYSTFRRITQELQRVAPKIAERIVMDRVRRITQ